MDNLVTRVGVALFGEAWQSEMARTLNVNPRTVRRWANGDIETPHRGIFKELAGIARKRMDVLEALVAEMEFGEQGSLVRSITAAAHETCLRAASVDEVKINTLVDRLVNMKITEKHPQGSLEASLMVALGDAQQYIDAVATADTKPGLYAPDAEKLIRSIFVTKRHNLSSAHPYNRYMAQMFLHLTGLTEADLT